MAFFIFPGSDPSRSESEDEDHVVEAAIKQQRLGTTSAQTEGDESEKSDKRQNSSDSEAESPSIIDNNPIEEVMVLSSESSMSKEASSSSESEAESIVVEAVVKSTLSKLERPPAEEADKKQFPSVMEEEVAKSPVAPRRRKMTSESQVASNSASICVPGSSWMTKSEIGVVTGPSAVVDGAVGGHLVADGHSALDDQEKEDLRDETVIQECYLRKIIYIRKFHNFLLHCNLTKQLQKKRFMNPDIFVPCPYPDLNAHL